MGVTALVACVILLLVALGVRGRMTVMRQREFEERPSPLSQALAGLVGTAGGIYLSLVLLLEFLNIEVPARVSLGPVSLEPLASISLLLAVIQPFVWRPGFGGGLRCGWPNWRARRS
ncbi:MAG: hypothetical protein H5T97_11145 [Firmicutes bacterium]|nr:hypothetical protein [Bacillota bacterium]